MGRLVNLMDSLKEFLSTFSSHEKVTRWLLFEALKLLQIGDLYQSCNTRHHIYSKKILWISLLDFNGLI